MAAVVGVIANLAIFFAIHTLFADVATRTWGPVQLQVPELSSLKPLSLAIALLAAMLLFRQKWSVLRTLGACALWWVWAPDSHRDACALRRVAMSSRRASDGPTSAS